MRMTPTQDGADALLLKTWQFRVAHHPKAIRAAKAMEQWHEDPRSFGYISDVPTAIVLPFKRKAFW